MPYAFETIRSGAVRCGRQGSCIRGYLGIHWLVYHWHKSYSAACRKSCPVRHSGVVSDRSDKSCKSVRIRTCRLSDIMRNAKFRIGCFKQHINTGADDIDKPQHIRNDKIHTKWDHVINGIVDNVQVRCFHGNLFFKVEKPRQVYKDITAETQPPVFFQKIHKNPHFCAQILPYKEEWFLCRQKAHTGS